LRGAEDSSFFIPR